MAEQKYYNTGEEKTESNKFIDSRSLHHRRRVEDTKGIIRIRKHGGCSNWSYVDVAFEELKILLKIAIE